MIHDLETSREESAVAMITTTNSKPQYEHGTCSPELRTFSYF